MQGQPQQHIRGIDAVRFVAALWVAFGHGASLPLKQLLANAGTFGKVIAAANGVTYCGPAAVMVFFVVSGLCIHLPYVGAQKVPVAEFYVRRFVRIGGPLLVVLLLAQLWPNPAGEAKEVLWSVYCELAYYTMYPLLFAWIRKGALPKLIALSTLVAVALNCLHWNYLRPRDFGELTFLMGYPAWLLGCLLAESVSKARVPTLKRSIWWWRGSAWVYSVVAMLLVYHLPVKVGYMASLLPFAFFCFFWLRAELARFRSRPPFQWLEAAGKWSFSLYLVHKIVLVQMAESPPNLPLLVNWLLQLAGMLGLSYLFFLLVERPCHRAARRWARGVRALWPYRVGESS
jgi:peptidoglycan/LPS O-acetylase OafA/YrhL